MKLVNFQMGTLALILVASYPGYATHTTNLNTHDLKRINAFENGLRPSVLNRAQPQNWSLVERMTHYNVPGVSIAVIKDYEVVFAKGYGVKEAGLNNPINTDTVFSVGSLSKVATAATALNLVSKGKLALDTDVNQYLKRWQVPTSKYTQSHKVTLRGILSHTAGLTLWGFPDFNPNEPLPTVINTLNGTGAAKTDAVRSFYEPGSSWRYSGGGTTVVQLMIEDVLNNSFESATNQLLFKPLAMSRSTFENPLPVSFGNIAKAHDRVGKLEAKPRGWHTFPEKAASGLWSSPSDYANLAITLMQSYHTEQGYLEQNIAQQMMTKVGYGNYGLGPELSGVGELRRFRHGGSNQSYKAWVEGHLNLGSGLVIFTNGSNGDKLIREIRRAVADAFDWPFYRPYYQYQASLDKSWLTQFTGTYKIPKDVNSFLERGFVNANDKKPKSRQVKLKENKLYYNDTELFAIGPNRFVFEGDDELNQTYFEFVQNTQGRFDTLIIREGENSMVAFKGQ
ncbi:beta-lactamase family protein [Pseudoalteromonas luteoviolacea]|uniref:serine hydrolase domain-containing protein n=1 Tax=Pseudoalteromonas luteoviolacea TaxID=43657 RepID=UPI001B3A4671|nr:serine hydrolase domain-containing protein [Pseudoalteromonas luteoviolacea]MBQ4879038.1 beta-lactamase family protein [Pseudoalteromonas luteoviolacea]MBQ4908011.1 beta-lactamase family protein [Pseudoalteromonas luteoviolacea]